MKCWMGIDPGTNGGFAVVWEDNTWEVFPMDRAGLISFCREKKDDCCVCCLEQVHSMPKQGVASTFTFGKNAGFLEGVLEVVGIPYQLISPQKWKKEFSLHNEKQASIDVCKQLFPGVVLTKTERGKKDHDGMAEALLMALYAKRKL